MGDDKLADGLLSNEIAADKLDSTTLRQSIRKAIAKNPLDTCVVLCGTALKNKGVQSLLDAVVHYLPAPNEKEPVIAHEPEHYNKTHLRHPKKNEKLCMYIFKVLHDKEKGPLAYSRVYSGVLKSRAQLLNVNKDHMEKVLQLFRVRASSYVNVSEVTCGDIVALSGLKHSTTGDTLVDSRDTERVKLQEIKIPPPVFVSALEYESQKDKPALFQAFKTLMAEDPSINVSENPETGQILVRGLGELHLEIFRDRLEREYNLRVKLGKMKVAYRESILEEKEHSIRFQQVINGKPYIACLDLKIKPLTYEELEEELSGTINRLLHLNQGEKGTEHKDTKAAAHTPGAEPKKPTTGQTIAREHFIQNHPFVLEMDITEDDRFKLFYREFKKREELKRTGKKPEAEEEEQTPKEEEDPTMEKLKTKVSHYKHLKNPVEEIEVEEYEDEHGQDTLLDLASAPFELLQAIERAIALALGRGSLLGYPMFRVKVTICGGKYSLARSKPMIFEMAANKLMKELIDSASPILLEPMMEVEVITPTDNVKDIVQDIVSNRRGRIDELNSYSTKFGGVSEVPRSIITSTVPLSETLGYSTFLRSISKGEASYTMVFKDYEPVSQSKQKEILANPYDY
eukprot:TRINITY_DN3485_c0_g2_i3.p1 TRINITY_DN3485_c0_g2~~TRINITY_DN3485_c0_g2_i3.p1  ORF type:complete len:627 (+),score=218.06 TRINITY_DN3485_c0_g2_i3:30-1910(+)